MNSVLQSFGLSVSGYSIAQIGTGHIHQTYKLTGKDNAFVLQRINKNIFRQPEIIASNLRIASDYLSNNFPGYNFLQAIPTIGKSEMFLDQEGFYWRLFPFQSGTFTIDSIDNNARAFNAAQGFARLTANLDHADVRQFRETLPDFHNLSLRYQQFLTALNNSSVERKDAARDCIEICKRSVYLVRDYEHLIESGVLKLRVTHNDTKINNILFDEITNEAVLVIDLDTLMPGYFIYDLGDMVRTFVSPVTEEEADFSKIIFRKEIYEALLDGYLSEMGIVLLPEEKLVIPFAGKMMTLIMALRFLADYLNGDIYYQTHYAGQNLVRARNQLRFLEVLEKELPLAD